MTNEMITALVLPAGDLPYLAQVPRTESYSFIKSNIDGFFDVIRSADSDFHGYVHDEGLLIGLPINVLATALFGSVLTGTCVVFGTLNAEGVSDGEEHSVTENAKSRTQFLAGAYSMWLDAHHTPVS